ncbi:MAG: PIN domain-containing protein [Planctomycetaceae bacterium]|nr:PIN domain-containing protein [Planctomycetaceae bacterium]
MILTDTGPLIAILDRRDPNHAACVAAARSLPAVALLTTWPCFTEAMYLLHRANGYAGQRALWGLVHDRRLVLLDLLPDDLSRMEALMGTYRDTPMDLADASIVVAAERLVARRLFTLDSDFRVFRLSDGSALELVP